jgi:hypothetical protein
MISQHKELSKIKQENCEKISLLEEQLAKYRDLVEDREKEISSQSAKLATSKRQYELDLCKIIQEKEKYR